MGDEKMNSPTLLTGLAIAYLILVACVDYVTHRIPNWLTGLAAAMMLAYQYSEFGNPGLVFSILGMLVAMSIFFPLYLIKTLGAGDVKAIAAVGIVLGPKYIVLASAAILISGLALAVIQLFMESKSIRSACFQIIGILMMPLVTKETATERENNENSVKDRYPHKKMPYGLSIAIGSIGALLYKRGF